MPDMNLTPGQSYHVTVGTNAQSPNFVGEYVGELTLAHGEIAHEFIVQGSLDGMPARTSEWHPVLLPSEIISLVPA